MSTIAVDYLVFGKSEIKLIHINSILVFVKNLHETAF